MDTQFRVDPEIVAEYIAKLASYGAYGETGVWRPAYSAEWVAAQLQVELWCSEAGLTTHLDAVGNVWGVLPGREAGGSIVTGSHIDTQLPGGQYDGALGVISAIIALKTLKEQLGQPRRTLELVSFCQEEASRFPTASTFGSRAVVGAVQPDEVNTILSFDGESIGDAMKEVDLDPSRVAEAKRTDIDVFVELHIEQGPLLELHNIPVSVVSGITGMRRFHVEVNGRADHAGARPMDMRRDAMAGAAEMVSGVINTAHRMGRPAVSTVGWMEVEPNAPAIVPERVRFTIDARHPDRELGELLYARHEALLQEVANRRELDVEWAIGTNRAPQPADPELIALFEDVLHERGLPVMTIPSAAGHDASRMADIARMVMLFVQSEGGRSHTPDEFTRLEHAVLGIEVLTEGLYRLAYA